MPNFIKCLGHIQEDSGAEFSVLLSFLLRLLFCVLGLSSSGCFESQIDVLVLSAFHPVLVLIFSEVVFRTILTIPVIMISVCRKQLKKLVFSGFSTIITSVVFQ